MSAFKVGVIVGSNRRESINRRLAGALVRLAEDRLSFDWIAIDGLPIYNADLEGERPAAVNDFTAAVARTQALLVVTPEHNRSLPTVLKNAIDWGSKPSDKNVWRGKPAAIIGASPGAIGTAVAQQHLRQILGTLGTQVMGGEAYISFKPDLVDAAHEITNPDTRAFLKSYMDRFVDLVERMAA